MARTAKKEAVIAKFVSRSTRRPPLINVVHTVYSIYLPTGTCRQQSVIEKKCIPGCRHIDHLWISVFYPRKTFTRFTKQYSIKVIVIIIYYASLHTHLLSHLYGTLFKREQSRSGLLSPISVWWMPSFLLVCENSDEKIQRRKDEKSHYIMVYVPIGIDIGIALGLSDE